MVVGGTVSTTTVWGVHALEVCAGVMIVCRHVCDCAQCDALTGVMVLCMYGVIGHTDACEQVQLRMHDELHLAGAVCGLHDASAEGVHPW